MIKKLFSLVFLLLVLAILSPVILLALMYQSDISSGLPTETYMMNVSPSQIVSQELDDSLAALDNLDEDIVFSFSEETLNTLIYASFTQAEGLNPEYQPESDCETDACQFLITENITDDLTLYLKGIWVELSDDQISVFVSGSMNWQDRFNYQTILSLVFNITDDEDAYRLNVDRVRLGRLPVTSQFVGRILGLIENLSGQPVLEVESDLPVGSLDLETFSITIPKAEIVSTVKENQELENNLLIGELIEIFFENQLLTFKLEEQAFNFYFKSSLLLSDETTTLPASIEDLYDATTPLDLNAYFQDQFQEFLLSQALLGETTFNLNQRVLNTIVASSLQGAEGLPDFSWTYLDVDGNEESITARVEGVWITLNESSIIFHALFDIASFPSLVEFTLDSVPSDDPLLLVYEINGLTMGKSPLVLDDPFLIIDDVEAFIPIIRDTLTNDFIQFNELNQLEIGGAALENYLNTFLESSGITLADISVVDEAILLGFNLDPNLQSLFDSYANAINDVLGNENFVGGLTEALDPASSPEAEEFINEVTTISEKLNDNQTVSSEDVDGLLDEFADLSQEEQEAFFNVMQSLIDPALLEEFENSFND
jgi:hypothetical protein